MNLCLLVVVLLTVAVKTAEQQQQQQLSFDYSPYTFLNKNKNPIIEDDLADSENPEAGRLTGDVQNWAAIIQNYIIQLASDNINRDLTQELFDLANYTLEAKEADEIIKTVKEVLSNYFRQKQKAAERIAQRVQQMYDLHLSWNSSNTMADKLSDLSVDYYRDSDVPKLLPKDIEFSSLFKQNVSFNHSIVKISDEIPRNDPNTINTVVYTKALEEVFKENWKNDDSLRWQYFGSSSGLMRLYPAREWDTNFAGFYNDYDPRVRNWYIAATSGPKDVIIVIDCSLSMAGENFEIAKSVAKAVIDTLTAHDYVNVICARESHWNEVGKSQSYQTEVLSCQQNRIVQATLAHRRDLKEKVTDLVPGGTTELEQGFKKAFDLLNSNQRTACQSIIVFITDGQDSDGETVRCGEGYFTRSGYVPGPICIYNWTKLWELTEERNRKLVPKARIFSYLTKSGGEQLPGHLACSNNGSFRKLDDGENLISKMSNYYEFLSYSTYTKEQGIWTSPYIDSGGLGLTITYAVPAVSKKNTKLIGVAAVDVTLEEIENILTTYQWGDVYSFLINKQGEAIFHPSLSVTTHQNIIEDPIAVPINKLEQDKQGNPKEFNTLLRNMVDGKEGKIRIEDANRLLPKKNVQPATYYYASLSGSDYSFAYSLSDTDRSFREISEPSDLSKYKKSYFNLLIEYNNTNARFKLPNEFETLQVKINETKYPGLRVSYPYSSIFFAPNVYCDPNDYFYDDDLESKTVDAHNYINSHILNKAFVDLGCAQKNKYKKGTRAYVLISQPIEEYWKTRPAEQVKEVKWTYVGMRTGVFRTYPGHRSNRLYNPVSRAWYKRALNAQTKTTLSSPYLDAAGAGKIITISQAVFEGMQNVSKQYCENSASNMTMKKKPGGCHCMSGIECQSGVCYVSKAAGVDTNLPRCATNRLIGVTGTDLGYNDFQTKIMSKMKSSDEKKSCGYKYKCPDGVHECETRCYLFDTNAILIVAPQFITEKDLEEKKYSAVNLGIIEGEIMKDLIYKHQFLRRTENIDFSGTCTISPYQPKVTLEGIPINPEDQDNYYKNRGPIRSFQNEYGCIQDAVRYSVNEAMLGKYQSNILVGNVSGPCMSGYYYVAALPKTNLFLLVIENWQNYKESFFYNFNCRITKNIVNSGNFQLINGTCSHEDLTSKTMREENRCPKLKEVKMKCSFNRSQSSTIINNSALFFLFKFLFSYFFLFNKICFI